MGESLMCEKEKTDNGERLQQEGVYPSEQESVALGKQENVNLPEEKSGVSLPLVNPFKVAPSIGAAFALQGVRKAAPFYHTSPGCTFLSKVLLTRHFQEPVSIQGTDMKETGLIYGGQKELIEKIEALVEKQNPDIIGVISSTVSQIRGDEFEYVIKYLKKKKSFDGVVLVEAPDYAGGFAEGFGASITALVRRFAVPGETIQKNVNIFPAPWMNAADIDEIKRVVSLFELNPVVIPDLSIATDGSDASYSQMAREGTTMEDLVRSARSGVSFSFGHAMSAPGWFLHKAYNVPFQEFSSFSGVRDCDELIRFLMNYSGREPTAVLKRERARLVDLMVDAHLHMAGRRVHLALEHDHALAMRNVLEEWGSGVEKMILPQKHPKGSKGGFSYETGGLYLLEEEYRLAKKEKSFPDLLISNSHGRALALEYDLPFIPMGFPVYDYYGASLAGRSGYAGTTRFLIETANLFQHTRREK